MIWTKVCYSDECGEPCLSQQANARAELANVKRQLAITARHLGDARADLKSVQKVLDDTSAEYLAESQRMHRAITGRAVDVLDRPTHEDVIRFSAYALAWANAARDARNATAEGTR